MILEILLILVLTVVNGLLSMSELAVVSSRPARLASMAEKGDHGAQVDERVRVVGELEAEAGRIHPAERGEDRVDDVVGERLDDRGERGADDHGDSQVDDVAAHDELFEALQHSGLVLSHVAHPSVRIEGRGRGRALRYGRES